MMRVVVVEVCPTISSKAALAPIRTMGHPRTADDVMWKQPIDSGPLPKDGESYDSIVVGGGPGGAAAAGYLAMEGKRVLLIEKETWPRDKICGDAVGGKSLSHVKDLGVIMSNNLTFTPYALK